MVMATEATHVAAMKAATAKAAYMSVATVVATKARPIACETRPIAGEARTAVIG